MGSTSLYWRETGKQLIAVLLALGLGACQLPGSSRPTMGISAASPTTNAKITTHATDGMVLRGHADFPVTRGTQATAAQVINRATLTLTELSTNTPIITGQTDSLGNFSLALNGYAPVTNAVYLLEASKGLNNNAAGAEQVRMRTFLKWNGTGWLSISNSTVGGAILLNSLTTAVALISNLDSTGIDPANTVGKVNGTSLNGSPSYAGHSNTEITNLSVSLANYLTNNLDPVAGVSGVLPNLTSISPPDAPLLRTVALSGSGFSPLVGGNTVIFAGGATASVYVATPTTLYVVVPSGAISGTVTVKTSLGTSTGITFTVDPLNGTLLSQIQPPSGVPGDFITLTGEGFNPTPSANTVTFPTSSGTITVAPTYASVNSLIVSVPSSAVSGPVTVTIGGNTTNRVYFDVNVPQITGMFPNAGDDTTSIIVSGAEFGPQGTHSSVLFNGNLPSSVFSWGPKLACVYPPAPSLTNKISGPLRLVTSANLVSAPYSTFTARASLKEDFQTSQQLDSSSTAAWGGGLFEPGPVSIFSQAGTQFANNTNASTTGLGASSAGLGLDLPALPHTGFTSGTPYFNQLGVDASSYFITTGLYGDSPKISRYALKDGSLLGTSSRSGVSGIIWDRANARYASYSYYSSTGIRTYANWNDTNYMSSGAWNSPLLGTTGSYYFVANTYGPANILGTQYNNVWNLGFAARGGTSAGGIATGGNIYVNPGMSTLSSVWCYNTSSGSSGSVSLPFPIGALSYEFPMVGSDEQSLYILGTNAAYNGGAMTLFKFSVTGNSISLIGAPSGTCITPSIPRPANSIWDSIAINKTVPSGTSCIIDILDGTTDALLLSNVTNGQNLNGLSASSIKLRATLNGTTSSSPTLMSWSVSTRGNYALSTGYDSRTNFATYEAPTILANNASYTIQYSDSADNVTWGSWVSDVTTLSRRYVRYRIYLNASTTQITGITLPYQY